MAIPTTNVDLDQLANAIETFKLQRDQAEKAIDTANKMVMDQLKALNVTSTTTRGGRKITLVEPVRTSWDPEVLRSILGPQLWERVTRQVLDPDKLEAVVEEEKIPTETLSEALIEMATKPYPRIGKPKPAKKAR